MNDSKIEEIRTMQTFLESDFQKDAHVYTERIRMLGVYMARSGVLLAEAKYEYNDAMGRVYTEDAEILKRLSPMQTKDYIRGKLSVESFYVDWLDRINANCVHQSDNLRTLLSYEKTQMQMI